MTLRGPGARDDHACHLSSLPQTLADAYCVPPNRNQVCVRREEPQPIKRRDRNWRKHSTCENEVITCSTSVPVKPSNPVYLAGSSLSPLIVNQSPAEQQQRMKSRAYGAWSATRTRFYVGIIKAIRLGIFSEIMKTAVNRSL